MTDRLTQDEIRERHDKLYENLKKYKRVVTMLYDAMRVLHRYCKHPNKPPPNEDGNVRCPDCGWIEGDPI